MKVALFSWFSFVLGSVVTYLIYYSLGITWKSESVIRVPNYMSEPRITDETSALKNEIAQLTKEKIRLNTLLNDLRKTVTEQRNVTNPERFLDAVKTNISKIVDDATIFRDRHVHYDDTTVADSLYNSTRVLCLVMTQPENLETRAIHISRTWGMRCNKLLFFSSVENKTFPTVGLGTGEGRNILTAKCFRAFRYVYENFFNDFDWFIRTDDDSYVIMENLRYFLSGQNTRKPIFFGHKFKVIVTKGYFAGGPGIVLSKEALHRFGTKGQFLCPENTRLEDDVTLGLCMQSLGVTAGDSLDTEGRSRFHCFEPVYHVMGSYPAWFYTYDANGAKAGISSMSDYAIGFHYTSPSIIYLLEYLVYHLRPYGVQFADLDLNKPVN